MKDLYITVTGMNHYFGLAPFYIGKKIRCVKEPKNPFDSEAIRCELKDLGRVGYVANSVCTVITGTKSAGSIGHRVRKHFTAEVMFISKSGIICRVTDGFRK